MAWIGNVVGGRSRVTDHDLKIVACSRLFKHGSESRGEVLAGHCMTKRKEPTKQFAVCINTDDPDLLTPRMIYQIIPDKSAARSSYLRVIDNEGEDYLYPAEYFILFDFPPAIERALLQVSP